MSTLNEIIKFKPRESQKQISDCKEREMAICAGRRWGKSVICAYIITKEFYKAFKKLRSGEIDSWKCWIVAPNYELTQKVFDYVVKFLLKAEPDLGKYISSRPFPQIRLTESFWIQCKSAENPTSLLGEELDLIIIDEAARISKNIWDTYIYPTTTIRKGKVIFISTPFGQNWFFHKYNQCAENNAAFHFESRDNPLFEKSEWDKAKLLFPAAIFSQEYEATFNPDAAAVFRGIDEIIKDNCLSDYVRDHRYVMGVDLGKHEDFTVITVIDKYNNNVVYFDRFNTIDYPFQKARIKATSDRYAGARVILDSTGVGEPIKDDLMRAQVFVDDFVFTNKSKKELIEKLSIFIEQKNVFIPNEQKLISELREFGYHLTDSGNVIYGAPEGSHDDCVCSLALAVWGLIGKAHPKTALQEEMAKAKRVKVIESNI